MKAPGVALLVVLSGGVCHAVAEEAEAPLVSSLASDEVVVFFATAARLAVDGRSWVVPVHGWVYEPEEDSRLRAATLGLFRRALGLEAEDARSTIFKERVRAFLVDNEGGKRMVVRVGKRVHALPESGPNGHFEGELRLPVDEVDEMRRSGEAGGAWIRFQAVLPAGDERVFAGAFEAVGDDGLSVVSDIDDTIKVTGVLEKKELLANTFLREFRAVPGMADLYRAWSEKGACFHYVSSSPWQLHAPLAEFTRSAGFPAGSFHLKLFRWKDSSFFELFASPEETKPRAIEPLFAAYPRRRFLLVGDSGEKDPEVYGALARKHPERVARILIRATSGEDADAERFQKAFQGVPRERWQVFRDPAEVKRHAE
jgi:hypothetical protein